ncbi:10631_t:CDS:2, partial [Racocetra fulgida]
MEASEQSATSIPKCMRGITLIHFGRRTYRVPTASIPKTNHKVLGSLELNVNGKSGYNLNQIQRDSKTTITIQRGDDNVENVEKAIKRIENSVKWVVTDFQSEVASLALPNVDESMFIKPPSLHLTLGVLNLHAQEDIEGAVQLLKSLNAEIYDLVGTRSIVAKLLGIEVMENNPAKANVLYAKVEESEGRDVIIKLA